MLKMRMLSNLTYYYTFLIVFHMIGLISRRDAELLYNQSFFSERKCEPFTFNQLQELEILMLHIS